MIRLFKIVGVVILITMGCKNEQATKKDRYEIIKEVVAAMSKYDTLKLYQLIDTSQCFDIYSREGFLGKVDYVYKRLKNCDSHINKSAIKVEKEPAYQTKYTVVFCFFPEQPQDESFSLFCRFADYRKDDLMDFMDIEVHGTIKPTIPSR